MLEILQNFERAVSKLAPIVVILPGLAAVVAGLFVWLGGLGFKRLLAGLIGAVAGGSAGFFLGTHNIVSIAIAGAVVALIAMIFERVFIVMVAAALVAASGFVVLTGPYFRSALPEAAEITPASQPATVQQSIETVKEYAVGFGYAVRWVGSRMPVYGWAILAAVAVVSAVVGLYVWRLASALCCAAIGTTLIFVGMILLLSYRDAAPITKMSSPDRAGIYAGVFLGMIAFGTIEQWIVFGRQKRQPAKAKKDTPEPEQQKRTWRGM